MFVLGRASRHETRPVVDGGREFLVVPGSRTDALHAVRAVVLWGGVVGLVLVSVGAMAVQTGAV